MTVDIVREELQYSSIHPEWDFWSPAIREALDVAHELISVGIPVFVCEPDGVGAQWNPAGGIGKTGYFLPKGWQRTIAEQAALDNYEPGCALAMVCGHGLDGIDIDLQKDSQVEARLRADGVMPTVYAEASTPSGGKHYLVASLGIHSRDGVRVGLDVKAGTQSEGHGFLFIAPTVKRSKVTGEPQPYRWIQVPDLEGFTGVAGSDRSGMDFVNLVEGEREATRMRPRRGTSGSAEDVEDVLTGPVHSDLPADIQRRINTYIDATVDRITGELTAVHCWPEGKVDDSSRGWEKVCADAAMRLGRLARASWNNLSLDTAEKAFRGSAPVDENWTEVDVLAKWHIQSLRGSVAVAPDFVAQATPASAGEGCQDAATEKVGLEVSMDDVGGEPGNAPSWGRIDLESILAGKNEELRPTLFPRTDGVCLLYPGMVHSFHGESESGKSLLAQIEAARLVSTGVDVLYLDFESDVASVVGRMREFGATPEALAKHFDYRNPESTPDSPSENPAWTDMLANQYALAVVDGVTDSLGVFGFKSSKDNDDVAEWMRKLPRQLAAKTGAAVVLVDHVTKDRESRGRFAIGGQAKMSGLTGAAYTVEVSEALGRGMRGVITLRVGKDRPGAIRPHCGSFRKSDRTQDAARIIIDSTGGTPVVVVEPPGGPTEGEELTGGAWLPALMERASRAVEQSPGSSKNQILKSMGGNRTRAIQVIRMLVTEGYLSVESGSRSSQILTTLKPYRQDGVRGSRRAAEPGTSRASHSTGTGSGSYTEEPENQSRTGSGNQSQNRSESVEVDARSGVNVDDSELRRSVVAE